MKAAPRTLDARIAALFDHRAHEVLTNNLTGLEKEGLRVSPSGTVAPTPHPAALGSALTHPYITTDFSEALLEFVTPPSTRNSEALDWLKDLHVFAVEHLGPEVIWATSMPCVLEGVSPIPLAHYGTSNAARMKTAYRRGLGNRYGRTMQVIAGIHYNFSFASGFWELYREVVGDGRDDDLFRSDAYMGMIRNLQRYGWLIPYLFGASPAVCKSFLQGNTTDLGAFDESTYYLPFATSLRMGDIGYQNAQEQGTGMKASYDSLDSYIRSLTWAIETPCPQYEQIGIKVGGRYEQLNANVLQIENEYYSTVRPKQPPDWMEKPTLSLRRAGIRYVELRSLDVNAFHPLGIAEEQLAFLDVMMLSCLLRDSPRINSAERGAIDRNQLSTAKQGRDPRLVLDRGGRGILLTDWANELLEQMIPVAEILDGTAGGPRTRALDGQFAKVRDADATPSANMLAQMRTNREGFHDIARRLSEQHRDYFRGLTLSDARRRELEQLAEQSHVRQAQIEADDDCGFDEFLERYFARR